VGEPGRTDARAAASRGTDTPTPHLPARCRERCNEYPRMKGPSRWKQHQQDQNATHSTRKHSTPPKRHAPQTTSGIRPPPEAPSARSSTSCPRSRPAAGGAAAPAPAAPAAAPCPSPPEAILRAQGMGVRYALAGGAARGDRPVRMLSRLPALACESLYTEERRRVWGADPISGAPRTPSTPSPGRSARAAGTAQPARAAREGQGGVTSGVRHEGGGGGGAERTSPRGASSFGSSPV